MLQRNITFQFEVNQSRAISSALARTVTEQILTHTTQKDFSEAMQAELQNY